MQLVLDLLGYSAASYAALARYPVPSDTELVVSLDNFISEQFNLVKELVLEIKVVTLALELEFCYFSMLINALNCNYSNCNSSSITCPACFW